MVDITARSDNNNKNTEINRSTDKNAKKTDCGWNVKILLSDNATKAC